MDVRIRHAHAQLHTYIQHSPLAIQSPDTLETDQLQHDHPTALLSIDILSPPSSQYAFFPAKLKFGVSFKKCYFQFFICFLVLTAYI